MSPWIFCQCKYNFFSTSLVWTLTCQYPYCLPTPTPSWVAQYWAQERDLLTILFFLRYLNESLWFDFGSGSTVKTRLPVEIISNMRFRTSGSQVNLILQLLFRLRYQKPEPYETQTHSWKNIQKRNFQKEQNQNMRKLPENSFYSL